MSGYSIHSTDDADRREPTLWEGTKAACMIGIACAMLEWVLLSPWWVMLISWAVIAASPILVALTGALILSGKPKCPECGARGYHKMSCDTGEAELRRILDVGYGEV